MTTMVTAGGVRVLPGEEGKESEEETRDDAVVFCERGGGEVRGRTPNDEGDTNKA